MDTNTVIAISSAVSALATAAIAALALYSYRLSSDIRRESNARAHALEAELRQHQEELSDLYQALVIATMESGPGAWTNMKEQIAEFSKHYKGKTEIFRR